MCLNNFGHINVGEAPFIRLFSYSYFCNFSQSPLVIIHIPIPTMSRRFSFVETRTSGLSTSDFNTSIIQIIDRDNHAVLGPTFTAPGYPSSISLHYPADADEAFKFHRSSSRSSTKIFSIVNWPLGGTKIQPMFTAWYDALHPTFSPIWRSTGISYLLELSIQAMKPDIPLLLAGIGHWSTTSGEFHFREALMSPSIRDLDRLVGAPILGSLPPYNYEKKFSGKTAFETMIFNLSKIDLSYQTFIQKYHSNRLTPNQQHACFLLCFLSRTFACTKSQTVIKEFASLAEQLSQGEVFSLAPLLLAYLHNAIYEFKGACGEIAPGGPIWLLQFCLHAYFPSLGRDPSFVDDPNQPFANLLIKNLPAPKPIQEIFPIFYQPQVVDWEVFSRLELTSDWYLPVPDDVNEGDARVTEIWRQVICPRVLLAGLSASSEIHAVKVFPHSPAYSARQLGFIQGLSASCWFCPEPASKIFDRNTLEYALEANKQSLDSVDLHFFDRCHPKTAPGYDSWLEKHFISTHPQSQDEALAALMGSGLLRPSKLILASQPGPGSMKKRKTTASLPIPTPSRKSSRKLNMGSSSRLSLAEEAVISVEDDEEPERSTSSLAAVASQVVSPSANVSAPAGKSKDFAEGSSSAPQTKLANAESRPDRSTSPARLGRLPESNLIDLLIVHHLDPGQKVLRQQRHPPLRRLPPLPPLSKPYLQPSSK